MSEAKEVKPPDWIYLQFDSDGIPETFCVDRVNDNDMPYIRLNVLKDVMLNEIARMTTEMNDPTIPLAKMPEVGDG